LEVPGWTKHTFKHGRHLELPLWVEDTFKHGRCLELPGWLMNGKLQEVRVERNGCSLTSRGRKRFQHISGTASWVILLN
jgi:hypothetical protein